MDMGQVMAVMQQLPAGQDGVPQAETGGQTVQDGLFAEVLQGVSAQKTGLLQSVAENVSKEVPVLETQGDVALDALMAMMALAGNSVPSTVGFSAESTDKVADATVRQNADSESQNVKPALGALQSGQIVPLQAGGIAGAAPVMPFESSPSTSQAPQKTQQAQGSVQTGSVFVAQPDSRTGPVIDRGVTVSAPLPAQQAAVVGAGPEVKGMPVTVQPAAREVAPPALQHRADVRLFSEIIMPEHEQAVLLQKEAAVTERDEQSARRVQMDLNRAVTQSASPAEHSAESPQADRAQPVVTVRQQPSDVTPVVTTRRQEVSLESLTAAVSPATSNTLVVGTENRVLQLETPDQPVLPSSAQRLQSEAKTVQLPNPPLTQSVAQPVAQKSLHAVEHAETAEVKQAVAATTAVQETLETTSVPLETPEPQAVQQKMRVSAPVISVDGTAVRTDIKLEKQTATHELRGPSSRQSSEKLDHTIGIAEVAEGEMKSGSGGGDTFGQDLTGNFLSNSVHQQFKAEGTASVAPVTGAEAADSPRTAHTVDQVVQQVRDKLVNHVTKPGSDQIVLRLTPEHFGELKVNLNMDGQRLKVEIVAENATVRDSLMQNTDLLKESLSRQNIKMESFDVTTGGSNTADSGRGQADWRELAQRRQQNLWMPEGGYRMARQAVAAVPVYQAKSQHSMVDVHF